MVNWDAIVSREGSAVWRTVYRIVGNCADAEDCFQETFLAALPLWERQTISNPHGLLQHLATARALDRLRQRYRRRKREAVAPQWNDLPAHGPHPIDAAQSVELSERLREALASLPPKQGQVFCRFHLDDCDYKEIALEIGCTVNAVGVILHRARARLRELLAETSVPLTRPDQ